MARKNLTDRFIKTREAAAAGQRRDYHDAIVPGLALRVTDRGHKSFVLIARYPMKPKDPSRRALGTYGAITLEQARDKARGWLELIAKGIDPKVKEAKERAAAQRQQANSFGAVAEDFLAGPASKFVKRGGLSRTNSSGAGRRGRSLTLSKTRFQRRSRPS
jgi:hypothetical protein